MSKGLGQRGGLDVGAKGVVTCFLDNMSGGDGWSSVGAVQKI